MKYTLYNLQLLLFTSVMILPFNSIASELPILSANIDDNIGNMMSDEETSTRIIFLQSRFDEGKLHAQLWQYAWLGGFGVSVASRSHIVATENDGPERFDAAVGIFTSLSGVLSLTLQPLPASYAASRLRAMPEATAEQRRIKLEYGEQLLIASAKEIKRRRGWTIQGVFLLEQLLVGLAIAFIDDRPKDGLTTAAVGLLASELFTFTMPTKSVSDLNAYSNNGFRNKSASLSNTRFFLVPHAQGIRMAYFF